MLKRPRKADVLVLKSEGLRTRKVDAASSSQNPRLKAEEDSCLRSVFSGFDKAYAH